MGPMEVSGSMTTTTGMTTVDKDGRGVSGFRGPKRLHGCKQGIYFFIWLGTFKAGDGAVMQVELVLMGG